MERVIVRSSCEALQKARSASATDVAYPSKVPTITEPSGDGVIELANSMQTVPERLEIHPFGDGGNNSIFQVKAIGWKKEGDNTNGLWIPRALGEFNCTLSAAIGVAGKDVLDTQRFADTITLPAPYVGLTTIEVVSPADETIAGITLQTKGASKVEFIFKLGNATGANALVARR